MKKSKSIRSLFILTLGILLLWSPHTLATDYAWEVNSTGDDGDDSTGDSSCATSAGECTLRAALEESNAIDASGDTFTITFESSSTICLSSYLPISVSDASITIQGHDDGNILDGGNSAELGSSCPASSASIFWVMSAGNITLKNLTIQGGEVGAVSGAMYIGGFLDSLSISNSTIQYNSATSSSGSAYGGAIYANSAITNFSISDSSFSYNTVTSSGGASYGGAIYVAAGTGLSMNAVTFTSNTASSSAEGAIGGAPQFRN